MRERILLAAHVMDGHFFSSDPLCKSVSGHTSHANALPMEVLPSRYLGKPMRSRHFPIHGLRWERLLFDAILPLQSFESTWVSRRMVAVEGDRAVPQGMMQIADLGS